MSSNDPKVFGVIRARKWHGDPARPWKKSEGGFWLCPTPWATAIRHIKIACGPLIIESYKFVRLSAWSKSDVFISSINCVMSFKTNIQLHTTGQARSFDMRLVSTLIFHRLKNLKHAVQLVIVTSTFVIRKLTLVVTLLLNWLTLIWGLSMLPKSFQSRLKIDVRKWKKKYSKQ